VILSCQKGNFRTGEFSISTGLLGLTIYLLRFFQRSNGAQFYYIYRAIRMHSQEIYLHSPGTSSECVFCSDTDMILADDMISEWGSFCDFSFLLESYFFLRSSKL